MTRDNDKMNIDSLKKTQEFWSKRSGREISLEDAREIESNLFEFINILLEWDQQDKKVQVEGNQKNESQGMDGCLPEASGMTDRQASQIIQDVLNPKVTTDGSNITLSVEWPEDDVEDSSSISEADVDSLIEYFRDRFGKTLSREQAQEILNLHQE